MKAPSAWPTRMQGRSASRLFVSKNPRKSSEYSATPWTASFLVPGDSGDRPNPCQSNVRTERLWAASEGVSVLKTDAFEQSPWMSTSGSCPDDESASECERVTLPREMSKVSICVI